MKKLITLALASAAVLSMQSCIQDEPLSPEADILECIVDSTVVKSEPIISNREILILGIPNVINREALALEFVITEGATIEPASGTVLDFSTPQQYTVYSEDGKWSKTYRVTVLESDIPTKYDFEDWAMNKDSTYYHPLQIERYYAEDKLITDTQTIWTSGNAGFQLAAGKKTYDQYPTTWTRDSHSGQYAVKLETRATGYEFLPIAAGNLYIGHFVAVNAMIEPLEATRFGLPFGKRPVSFNGYYKYRPGELYRDKDGNVYDDEVDRPYIYSVLYEQKDGGGTLDGANILTDENIIAIAMVENPQAADEWTYFDVEFDYIRTFDPAKQQAFKYNLAVVFSSSWKGDLFMGAVGSTLYIDDVELICREDAE